MNVKSISRTVGLIFAHHGHFSAFPAAHRRHRSRAEKYTRHPSSRCVSFCSSAARFCCSAAAATACFPRRKALPQRVFRGFLCPRSAHCRSFLSGQIPSYVDAFFEMVSGFTTTGASILTDVEALSRCNLSGAASAIGSAVWACSCSSWQSCPARAKTAAPASTSCVRKAPTERR